MKSIEVSAKRTDGDDQAERTVTVDFPENVQEMVEAWGESVTYKQASAAATVTLQGAMRSWIKSGKTDDEIQAKAEEWKPGERQKGKTPQEKLRELYASLPEEERQKLLEDLMSTSGSEEEEAA